MMSGSSRSLPCDSACSDEVVAVAIDDERGHQIAFAVHQAIGRRVDAERRAKRDRALQTRAPEGAIDGHVVACQDPQRDLRLVAVETREPGNAPFAAATRTTAPGSARPPADIGAIHPEMAVLNALFAAGARR